MWKFGKTRVAIITTINRHFVHWVCIGVVVATLAVGTPIAWHMVHTFASQTSTPTLILDAGHGGMDGGAVGVNGTVEQYVNLEIVQRAQVLAVFFGVPTVLTRTDDNALVDDPNQSIRTNKVADIQARQQLAESTPNGVFVSIHLNTYAQAEYYGAQVFYSSNSPQSQVLAQNLQTALVQGIANGNNRTEKPADSSIYLMAQLQCPAVVVECGFLSNAAEEALLATADYQKQLAVCLVAGYLQSAQIM